MLLLIYDPHNIYEMPRQRKQMLDECRLHYPAGDRIPHPCHTSALSLRACGLRPNFNYKSQIHPDPRCGPSR